MLHIITGEFKGRKLAFPNRDPDVRPTSNRTRQAMFNILNSHIDFNGLRVVDLFCGSGALGLEALSRGAAHATFVDLNTQFIGQNISALQVQTRTLVLKQDATFAKLNPTADLILADPPYNKGLAEKLLKNPTHLGHPGSVWMIETEAEWPLSVNPAHFEVLSSRAYNTQALHLLRQL